MAILSAIDHRLTIEVRSAKEVGVSEFVVRNVDGKAVWDIRLATYDLLGPGDFGLDDTYIPAALRAEEIAQIRRIESKAFACIVRNKWGALSRYKGRITGTQHVMFSPNEDGPRFGMTVPFTFLSADCPSCDQETSVRAKHASSLSSRAGMAVSRLFRKRSPE